MRAFLVAGGTGERALSGAIAVRDVGHSVGCAGVGTRWAVASTPPLVVTGRGGSLSGEIDPVGNRPVQSLNDELELCDLTADNEAPCIERRVLGQHPGCYLHPTLSTPRHHQLQFLAYWACSLGV